MRKEGAEAAAKKVLEAASNDSMPIGISRSGPRERALESSSDLFVPWAIDPDYKSWVPGIKKSEAVLTEAKARDASLQLLAKELSLLRLVPGSQNPSARGTAAPKGGLSGINWPLADTMKLLYYSTYLEEVLQCERFDAGTLARAQYARPQSNPKDTASSRSGSATWASGSNSDPASVSASSALACSAMPAPVPRILAPARDALTGYLSQASSEAVSSMARWVWKVRFFMKKARRLGLRLLRAILLRILPVDTLLAAAVPEHMIPI